MKKTTNSQSVIPSGEEATNNQTDDGLFDELLSLN